MDDLIDAVLLYPLDSTIAKTSPFDVNLVKLHYCHLMYHALLAATKRSLNELKKRVSETGLIAADSTNTEVGSPAAANASAAEKEKAGKGEASCGG